MLSQTSAVFTRLLRMGIYTALFEHVALWRNDAFWTSLPGWLLALVFYDFCYYWLHRMGHESAVLWAAHAVHHQSQDYNLSPPRCARPVRARCWAGCSMCPWRWPACRRWCLAWWRWSTCSTSSGCTPSMSRSWAGLTAGSAAPATTACTTR
jgi:hypothetical protein